MTKLPSLVNSSSQAGINPQTESSDTTPLSDPPLTDTILDRGLKAGALNSIDHCVSPYVAASDPAPALDSPRSFSQSGELTPVAHAIRPALSMGDEAGQLQSSRNPEIKSNTKEGQFPMEKIVQQYIDISSFDHVMVLDLEATCSDKKIIDDIQVPGNQTEIIEIGAVMVDSRSLQPISEFQSFVRPSQHPTLSNFCTELTHIQQRDIDSAPEIENALEALANWSGQYNGVVFASWGAYDPQQIERETSRKGLTNPIELPHINLKKAFSACMGTKNQYGMKGALRIANIPLEGAHHRGIDDARNIAKLLSIVTGKQEVPE